jgi:wobble nucleotide-excising tRNase
VIRRITIQGFKSFSPHQPTVVTLDPSKRAALLYGLNGAGKSAIAQVLARHGTDPVPNCGVEFTRNEACPILVYNEAFVDRTFRNRATVPGIFTIGEPAAEALREAETLETDMAAWKGDHERLTDDAQARQAERLRVTTVAHEAVWSAYTEHKGTIFQPWLGGFGNSKQKLFEWIRAANLPTGAVPPSKDELAQRLAELGEQGASPREPVRVPVLDFGRIEADPMWAEPIVPMGQSQLAELISLWGNADWVRRGQLYLGHDERGCPFCQQPLPEGFSEELARLFDTSYTQRLEYVASQSTNYATQIEVMSTKMQALFKDEPFANEDSELVQAWSTALLSLQANAAQMEEKRASPTLRVVLTDTRTLLDPVSQGLSRVADRVDRYNERLGRWQAEYAAIKRDFCQRLRVDYDGAIKAYVEAVDGIEKDLESIQGHQARLSEQLRAGELRLAALRKSTAGTQKAVDAINERLSAIGVDSFRIAKHHEGDLYHLVRGEDRIDDYQSLSEGEKTLITFLYFVELVSGSDVSDQSVPLQRKIVVIDDPISSLSHNYVYDVAAFIARDLIEFKDHHGHQLKQVILLTHSLFFHHELLSVVKNEKGVDLHRVRKYQYSEVVALQKNELLNDYEAFWAIVKDAKAGKASGATVANAMRCILERFFYFNRRQLQMKEALSALSAADHRFVPLARYLDRQSHADANTRTDFSDYDVAYYLAKFEAVFQHVDAMHHYRAMLGEGDEETP